MQVMLIRTPTGFAPADQEACDALRKFKVGSVARLEVRLVRNYQFHKKWFALVKVGYDYFAESCATREYKGKPLQPDFDRFRQDITIMAGFYRPVWNIKGEMRFEAESLSFASMTEERFTQLFDATIQVLLAKVFNGACADQWTEEQLRSVVQQIEEFQ